MALADTGQSIAAVTDLLHSRLLSDVSGLADVTIGRPEPPKNGGVNNPRLNLFLYEVYFDGHLKNMPLDGQQTPLWLVLKYLLTAFDTQGDSDTIESHGFLGEAVRALQGLNFFPLAGTSANIIKALKDNPDLLKLTFDEASPDLLSKLMQGTEEKYRCSICFQVRPVMIASPEPPAYSLLVGVDYQNTAEIGEKGIHLPVLPSMGPTISDVSPEKLEAGDAFLIQGSDLDAPNLSVQLGPVSLAAMAQQPERLRSQVNASLGTGTVFSAGSHPLSVTQTLASGRTRSSNLLVVDVLPHLATAIPINLARVGAPGSDVFGDIDLTGNLLGRTQDDVLLALWRDGKVARLLDTFSVPFGPPPQSQIRVSMPQGAAIAPGSYRVILRVNGQQAKASPEVLWSA